MMHSRLGLFLGMVCILAAGLFSFWIAEDKIEIYFDHVEPIPGYKMELRDPPLRIAMISVLNHENTEEYQNRMADSIGRLLGRPVLLLYRKSYAEINQLITRGDADIAFLSSGAYMVYGKKEDVKLLVRCIMKLNS